MKINPHILRGYDFRGIAGKDLSPEIAEHFGKAYGTFMSRKGVKSVVLGRDSRSTSEEYKNSLAKGIISTGIDVIDIGMVMVGTVYWAQYYFKTEGAAMVTASHNPSEYNGFKFANGFSEAMVLEQLEEVSGIMEKEDYLKAEAGTEGKMEEKNINEIYYADLVKRFDGFKKFKVVVDPSCATPGIIVPELLKKIGCEVIESNCELDSSFPLGVPDPTEEAVAQRLSQKVLQEKADIGFSYDADGDRIGIVDEKGNVIWNDVLLALFSIDVLSQHPGAKIMYNTLCSKVVEETIKKNGGEPFMWRTGHGFLKKKNQEVKAAFIGELSGHFFFSEDFYNHDDGCYATLRLLNYLSRVDRPLSEVIATLPKYISSPEIKVGCPDDLKVGLVEKMAEKLRQDFANAEIVDDERAGDGVRLDMPDSMLVIRYSQNGPYLTVKFEGKTQEQYSQLKKYLKKLLQSYQEIDWNFGVNVEALD